MDIKIPRADTMRFNHSATLIQRDPNLTKWILIEWDTKKGKVQFIRSAEFDTSIVTTKTRNTKNLFICLCTVKIKTVVYFYFFLTHFIEY